MQRSNLCRWIVGLAALVLCGCSSTSSSPADAIFVETTLVFTSKKETNGGRPFYSVVRSVDQATHLTDTYEAIAAKIFARPADSSVLLAKVIYPGIETEMTVDCPGALQLGVYFLFTEPGERWKMLKVQPLPSSVEIDLGTNDIVTID
jgi:hypothetical protein